MIDEFSIKFYWNERAESLNEATLKTELLLKKLECIHPIFKEWHLPSSNREKALSKTFEVNSQNVQKAFLRNKYLKINSSGYSDVGFGMSLYKEDLDENQYSLRLCIGSNFNNVLNNCIFTFWNPFIMDKAVILNAIKAIIEILNPTWGCVDSDSLRSKIGFTNNKIGWITISKKNVNIDQFDKEFFKEYFIYTLKTSDSYFNHTQIDSIEKLKQLIL